VKNAGGATAKGVTVAVEGDRWDVGDLMPGMVAAGQLVTRRESSVVISYELTSGRVRHDLDEYLGPGIVADLEVSIVDRTFTKSYSLRSPAP